MEFTAENVKKAVFEFYNNPQTQQDVNRWLMAAQMSPNAWKFVWELLDKNMAPEVQFFGASSLHVKISKCWHEVPPQESTTLRTQLMQLVAESAQRPRMVLTRLCIALSAYIIQGVPDVWPDAILNILSSYQHSNLPHLESSQLGMVLLEILTVLPEEFGTAHLAQHRKSIVRRELQKALPQVLKLLGEVLSSSSPERVYEQALKCLSSWGQFGIPLLEVEPILVRVFEAVRNEQFFDTAIDTIINIFSHPDAYRYPGFIQKVLAHVLSLQDLLHKAIQQQDMDTCLGLVKLMVAAAEQNTRLLLASTFEDSDQRTLALNVVNLILQCTAIPGYYPVDECCSDMPFGFWYNLQDDLIACDHDQYTVLLQVYNPVYMSLVDILLQKVQYPEDTEFASWNAEEKEAHRCYRQDIADTFMYAYNLLHGALLGNLCAMFNSILERSAAEQVRWQETEAVLFAVTAVAESVDTDECLHLPSLFSKLGQVPCTNQKLVCQALYLIGSYAEWIAANPAVLDSVMGLMLRGLQDTELAQPATLSLKEVVRENQHLLKPYAADVLATSKNALESNILKYRDALRLMTCLGYVLSVLPLPEIMDYLNVLLIPHIQQLRHLADAEMTSSTKAAIQLKIGMLAWLFGSLDTKNRDLSEDEIQTESRSRETQPVLLVLQQVIPVLQLILQKWFVDPAIVECVCDMFKKSIRTLMDDISPLVNELSQIVIQMYSVYPHPHILDLSKQMLILFVGEEQHRNAAHIVFQTICNKTLGIFETDFREHPDVVETFMALLSQVAKKCPVLYSSETCNLVGLFQAGVVSLGLPEIASVKAASHFLTEILASTEKLPSVKEVVAKHGHTLVDRLIRAIGGESPRTVIDMMADVLFCLNKHHFEHLCTWMNAVVAEDGFPSPTAKRADKERFARSILKERVNKRKIRETVQEYTLLWRGLIGTEYAAQTSGHLI